MTDASPLHFLLEGPHARHNFVHRLVHEAASESGALVTYASTKQLLSRKVVLAETQVPVGSIPFIRAALQQRGLAVPTPDCYPKALSPFLHRVMRQAKLGEVLSRLGAGGPSVFIKPVEHLKRFTGFVADFENEYRLSSVSRSLRVWEVQVVHWKSEWRAYIVGDKVRHLAWYAGDVNCIPEEGVVRQMVDAYARAGAPAGYVLDVGVMVNHSAPSGEPITALIEANDGFAIGAYDGVSAQVYTALLVARWREMTQTG